MKKNILHERDKNKDEERDCVSGIERIRVREGIRMKPKTS